MYFLVWLLTMSLPLVDSTKCYEKGNGKWYITNANYYNSDKQQFQMGELLLEDGIIQAIDKKVNSDPSYKKLDLKGSLVTSGWIDLHTHAYYGGTYWGIKVDAASIESGVTTVLDTGSTGCFNFINFKESIIKHSLVDIYAFINIAPQGLVQRTGELLDPAATLDYNSTIDIIEPNLDLIKGIKVRLDKFTTNGNLDGLIMARNISNKFNIPLMIHIGHSNPTLEEIEPHLKKDDIITHCFNGHGNKMTTEDFKEIRPVVHKLMSKGVKLDVGHGGGGFNFKSAQTLIKQGILPFSISSDLHQISRIGSAKNLLNVFNKVWALGVPLEKLIPLVTSNPASVLGLKDSGVLKPGYRADIAVFEVKKGNFVFDDPAFNNVTSTQKLGHVLTIKKGKIMTIPKEPKPWSWALRDAGVVSGNKP